MFLEPEMLSKPQSGLEPSEELPALPYKNGQAHHHMCVPPVEVCWWSNAPQPCCQTSYTLGLSSVPRCFVHWSRCGHTTLLSVGPTRLISFHLHSSLSSTLHTMAVVSCYA